TCIAYRAGNEWQTIAAGAFDSASHLASWEGLQRVERERQWFGHHAPHVQPPGLLVHHGPLITSHAKEFVVWSNPRVQIFPARQTLGDVREGRRHWRRLIAPGNDRQVWLGLAEHAVLKQR